MRGAKRQQKYQRIEIQLNREDYDETNGRPRLDGNGICIV